MKIINKVILCILISLTVIFFGCSNYGTIKEDTLYLKFPIKLSINDKTDNWEIIEQHEPFFDIYVSNISKIVFNNLIIDGNYKILVAYSEELKTDKIDDDYFFYQILILSKDSIDQEMRDKILSQNEVLYKFDCDEYYEKWVDTKNNILIIMNNKKKRYTFVDMTKFYAEPKNRFPKTIQEMIQDSE